MKGVCNDKKISRGEIYVADLNPYQGFEKRWDKTCSYFTK